MNKKNTHFEEWKEEAKISRWDFPNRPQTISGVPMEILDASKYYQEQRAKNSPDLNVINSQWLFEEDEVIIGIWKPNVFLLIPDEWGQHKCFAAKSLYRAPSKFQYTRNRIQSSIFFILKNLSLEEINDLRSTAEEHVWSKNITCVNANMKILHEVGMILWNDEELNKTYLTVPLFRKIAEHGLKLWDKDLDIDTLKTTQSYLETQIWNTTKATILTLVRHLQRLFQNKEKWKIATDRKEEPIGYVMKSEEHHKNDIILKASKTSRLAVPLRLLWWPHTIFSIDQNRVDINDYLTDELKAYPDENPSFLTDVKKNVLFNETIVWWINRLLQKWFVSFPDKKESDIHNLFETDTLEKPCKYNIVSSENGSMLMKVDIWNKMVDWILTKHVLISNYDESVRFAWEIWKDTEGVVWINRNSWTYKPSEKQLTQFIQYLEQIFPNVTFQADNTV